MTAAMMPAPDPQLTLDYSDHVARMRVVRARLLTLATDMLRDDVHRPKPDGSTYGVSFDQVRQRAETRGWLTGEEKDRDLSFGAQIMREAGGVACEYRASKHRKAKCRAIRVFRLTVAVALGAQ